MQTRVLEMHVNNFLTVSQSILRLSCCFFKFFAMLQLRMIMKALLLVPFNTIYAQSCGDKLLRWKEKASNTAAANNSLLENA